MSKTFSFGINVDLGQIIRDIAGAVENRSYSSKYYDNNNGRWFSCQAGGLVICGNYHATQQHSATAQGTSTSKSTVPAGEWAVAYAKNNIFGGNKTFYDFGPHLM